MRHTEGVGKKSGKKPARTKTEEILARIERAEKRLGRKIDDVARLTGRTPALSEAPEPRDVEDVESEALAAVLFSLGHPVRMAMCREALVGPVSVTGLIEDLSLGTSGQVYHHLRILQDEGWLRPVGHGVYELRTSRMEHLRTLISLAAELARD